jgi:predicted PurR-regulated permease PerM
MEGQQVRKGLFLALFLALFFLVGRLFYPFMTVLIWSALLYVLLEPLHKRTLTKRDGTERGQIARRTLAGAFAICSVLVIVVPAFFLAATLVQQAGELVSSLLAAINEHPDLLDLSPKGSLGGFIDRLTKGRVDLSSINLKGELQSFLVSRVGSIINISSIVLKDAVNLVVNFAFMIFTLFFFFMDGRHLAEVLIRAIPIEKSYTTLFMGKLKDAGRQLILGYFLVAAFQGSVMFLLCLLFKVDGALVLACLTAVASFVPMIGTSLVWLPVSATIALGGHLARAVAFMVLCVIGVATLDNFLRPILLRDRLKIHPLLIFFAILGGLRLFGLNGLLLGPLVLMLFFAATELFDSVYAREEKDAPVEQPKPAVAMTRGRILRRLRSRKADSGDEQDGQS